MRAYFFGNMYLSSIQQGIQAQHCTAELFLRYRGEDDQTKTLYDWAEHHKTSILLNGGYGENLHALIERFDNSENPYPWAQFNESEEALDGALTCVGIILPEKIYTLAGVLRTERGPEVEEKIRDTGKWLPISEVIEQSGLPKDPYPVSKWELELCKELNKCGLAS